MKKRTAVLWILALLFVGGIALAVVVAAGLGAARFPVRAGVPARTILEADFETALLEYLPDDPVAEFLLRGTPVTRDVVEALERAAADDRVVGFIARVGSAPMGLAQIQELRDAVALFRASGKPAIAYAETLGEFGPGNGAYYLATAFDEIHLQPSGDVGLTGLIAESPFFRGTLEKLGIEARLDHRYEYKNAMNSFTETGYTEAHREAVAAVVGSLFAGMVEGIAEARAKTSEEVRELVDRGPFLGPEAVAAGLVDRLSYRDEAYARIRELAGNDADLLYLGAYLKRAGRPHDSGETIALIFGVGDVTRGANGFDPVSGALTMGADSVAAAFRAAIDDADVRAILFRVDSPGGSYVGSDTIWRETVRAREAGKPVVVSMGDIAGSGGYYVAMAADKIVAQPATITGSIGVYGGKFLTREFWRKLGMSFDEVHDGEHATYWSSLNDFSDEEHARFQAWLDRVYEDFTAKVAAGRGLSVEEVQRVARGRIWTGADAREIGLVDALGGYPAALRLAREAAGLAADAAIHLEVFPKRRSPFERLFGEGPSSSEERAAAVLARALEEIRPLVRIARRLGLGEAAAGPLTMPPDPLPR